MSVESLHHGREGEPSAPWRHVLALGLALTVGLLATPAIGQERAEAVAPDGQLTLEVRKGRVIRLSSPAATVFVADPEIADVQAQSPSIVYLFGRRAGSTSLYAVDENDQVLLRTNVVVEHNLTGLRQATDRLIPSSRVSASTVDGSIVMRVQSTTRCRRRSCASWRLAISARTKACCSASA